MFPEASWTEDRLREEILVLCTRLVLIVNYHKAERLSPARGWPDLEIVGPRGILHRELKTMAGQLSTDQRRVGSKLNLAGGNWAVWRPADWATGVIQNQLLALV